MTMALVKTVEKNKPALRAIGLVRLSTTEQLSGGAAGLGRQYAMIESICTNQSYDLIEVVEEVGTSGSAVSDSPKIQRLLKMAEDKSYDVLCLSETSRLIRPDDFSSFAILDVFRQNGVVINAGGTVHDYQKPEGFLAGGLTALMAGHDRQMLLSRMITSKNVKRREGKCPGSAATLPTGLSYDREQEKYTVNKDIAKVQEAFRLLVSKGIKNLSEISRRVGIKSPTLKCIYRNPAYKGIRRYDTKRSTTQKYTRPDGKQADRPKVKRTANEIIEVRIFEPKDQPITDLDWATANKILDEIRTAHHEVRGSPYPHAISGIGECGYCLKPLIGVSAPSHRRRKGNRGHYLCRSNHYTNKGRFPKCNQGWLDKQKLEDTLIAFTHQQLCDETLVREMVDASNKLKSQKITAFVAPAPEELMENLNKKLERLLSAYEAGVYTIDELKDRRAKLERERDLLMTVAEEQADLKEGGTDFKIEAPLIEKISSIHLLSDPHERKRLLHLLYESVLFEGYAITAFRFAPNVIPQNCSAFPDICTEGYVTLPQPFRIHEPEPKRVKPKKRRKCNKCSQTKPLDEFNRKSKKGGDGPENRRKTCADCYRQQNRERAKKRKEEGGK